MSSPTDLDNPGTYATLDPSSMRERIAGLAGQCRRAWQQARTFSLSPQYGPVDRVVLLGMGGSAIGGDLLASLPTLEDSLPIQVCRDYVLPPGVGPRTLAIASSYSGNTEETLSAFEEAVARGARVMAVTSGGLLAQRCQHLGIPLFTVDYRGEPRSALGYSFVAPLALLCGLGLVADQERSLEEAAALLERQAAAWAPEVSTAHNPAKALAQQMYGRLVVVYGAGILTGVARRWKTQVNENAKAWAFYEPLPELDHNAVVGYVNPHDTTQSAFVVLLKPSTPPSRTSLRYAVTMDTLEKAGVAHRLIEAEGHSPLAQMLGAVYLGDYASYYLALLYGVDPSQVATIDYLKERLAGG